jgi:hypothetical protein
LKEFAEAPNVKERKNVGCGVIFLKLGDAKLEDGGQMDCMGQAKRKARKHGVTDIDDSKIMKKPAVNGVFLTLRQVSAR